MMFEEVELPIGAQIVGTLYVTVPHHRHPDSTRSPPRKFFCKMTPQHLHVADVAVGVRTSVSRLGL